MWASFLEEKPGKGYLDELTAPFLHLVHLPPPPSILNSLYFSAAWAGLYGLPNGRL